MTPLRFRVAGTPVTQGSHRAWKPKGADFAHVVDANQKVLRPWRDAIRCDAQDAAGPAWQPLDCPVRVILHFAVPRPRSAPKRRRTWPTGARSGDVDKLARAALDALTDAGIWTDDARVVELIVTKDYAGDAFQPSPGVVISVQPIEHAAPLSRNQTQEALNL